MGYRLAPWPLMTVNCPSSRSSKLHIKCLKNGDRYDNGVNRSRIGTNTCAVDWHHDLWPWMTLNCPCSRSSNCRSNDTKWWQVHTALDRLRVRLNDILFDNSFICFVYSYLQSLTYCYARVLQETCNTSAADMNVLKTIVYNAKFRGFVSSSCALGESQSVLYCSEMKDNYISMLHS